VSRTLFRYVLRTYATLAAGIFAGMLAIFLVVDFVDRSKSYTGPNWVRDVAELYGWNTLLVIQQLGPAALMLGAGVAVSALRKRGEVTALRSLSAGPSLLYLPIGLCALLAAFGLMAFDEAFVTKAGRRVDEIQAHRFDRWGDWRIHYQPKQWFRRGDWVLFLRRGDAAKGFEEVTLLKLSSEFDLAQRIDAGRMEHVEGTRWRLSSVVERSFGPEGHSALRTLDSGLYDVGIPQSALHIMTGRPEQMRLPELREQIRARHAVGLPTRSFDLTLHNRFAYPLAGVPAALLAIGLALRPNRKGHLTTALVEGLVVAMCLWGMMVVCKALVLNDRLGAGAAAWTPVVLLSAVSCALWLGHEGLLPRRRA
jgi:lipopolysaccharide export system permease protein